MFKEAIFCLYTPHLHILFSAIATGFRQLAVRITPNHILELALGVAVTNLSKQENEAFRFQKSFTLYEISMLWINERPRCENRETRDKPVSYYVVCSELIRAINNKEIDPKAVKEVSESHHYSSNKYQECPVKSL